MKVTKTFYKCDICGNEYNKSVDLKKITIPCKENIYNNDDMFFPTMKEVDMCEYCCNEYFDVVFENFGVLTDNTGKINFKKVEKFRF